MTDDTKLTDETKLIEVAGTTVVVSEVTPVSVEFRTKDINHAAFMWAQPGTELVKLDSEREKGLTIFFQFRMTLTEAQLMQLLFDYANGKTSVEPQQYCKFQNNLRDLLHSTLNKKKESK